MDKLPIEQVPGFLAIVGGSAVFCFIAVMLYEYRHELMSIARWLLNRYVELRPGRVSTHNQVHDGDDFAGANGSHEPANPGSSAFSSGELAGTAGSAFTLNPDELRAVQAMIRYRDVEMAAGRKPTKAGAILAGFGVKRGGSERYQAASAIYDALFGEPDPSAKYRPIEVDGRSMVAKG